MSYFPSSGKLQSLGFKPIQENYSEFKYYSKPLDSVGKQQMRIMRRNEFTNPQDEIRLVEMNGNFIRRKLYNGNFVSENFFDEFLSAIGWQKRSDAYIPTPQKLEDFGYHSDKDDSSGRFYWSKRLDSEGYVIMQITRNDKSQFIIQEMKAFGSIPTWPRFEGYFPSESFFDTLLTNLGRLTR